MPPSGKHRRLRARSGGVAGGALSLHRERGFSGIALQYTSAIIEHCEKLHAFPHRGTPRDDIRPGLRVTHYKRRTVIVYAVEHQQVFILGVFYGGRDYEGALQTDPED